MTESVTDKVVEHISDNSLTNGVLHAGNWITKNQDLLVQYAVNIVSAILILFIGNIIVKMIAGTVAKVLRKKDMDNAVVEFIHGLVRYLLFVIVLIAALGRIGVKRLLWLLLLVRQVWQLVLHYRAHYQTLQLVY